VDHNLATATRILLHPGARASFDFAHALAEEGNGQSVGGTSSSNSGVPMGSPWFL